MKKTPVDHAGGIMDERSSMRIKNTINAPKKIKNLGIFLISIPISKLCKNKKMGKKMDNKLDNQLKDFQGKKYQIEVQVFLHISKKLWFIVGE